MTRPCRPPSLWSSARPILLALLAAAGGLVSACSDDHVGRPCVLGAGEDGYSPGGIVTIAAPAIECPSNICLGPTDTNAQGVGALCTVDCESNDDCEDGEIARGDDPSDHRCKSGFVCAVATTVGNFACRSLCVCRDVFPEPDGGYVGPGACL